MNQTDNSNELLNINIGWLEIDMPSDNSFTIGGLSNTIW